MFNLHEALLTSGEGCDNKTLGREKSPEKAKLVYSRPLKKSYGVYVNSAGNTFVADAKQAGFTAPRTGFFAYVPRGLLALDILRGCCMCARLQRHYLSPLSFNTFVVFVESRFEVLRGCLRQGLVLFAAFDDVRRGKFTRRSAVRKICSFI